MDDLKTIALAWIEWTVLDAVWKWFLGATVAALAGWILARYQRSRFQAELRGALIGLTACTLIIMASLLLRADITPSKTQIRWEFLGGQRAPEVLSQDNIETWYAQWSPSVVLKGQDVKGNTVAQQVYGPYWTLFLTFNHPVSYRQILLSSPNISTYEVKQQTSRSAVIMVGQDIPAGEVDVSAVP